MNQKCQWQKGRARFYGCNPGDLCMVAERMEALKTSKWAEGRKRSHLMPFHYCCYFTLKQIQMSVTCFLFIKSGSVPPSASISRPEGVTSDSIQISWSCTLPHFNQSIIDRNCLSPPPPHHHPLPHTQIMNMSLQQLHLNHFINDHSVITGI